MSREVSQASATTVVFFGPLTVPLPGQGFQARVVGYGDELEVSEPLREAGRDRLGASWLDLLDDPAEQVRKWGLVLFSRGPWPADRPRIKPGSMAWEDVREARRREAFSIQDDAIRAERLRQVDAEFGRPVTSRTVRSTPGGVS